MWGWGYGGEGQLGLGSRIRMVSSPHPVPCIDSSFNKGRSLGLSGGNMGSEIQGFRVPGNYVKAIACGGRHSAVITGILILYLSSFIQLLHKSSFCIYSFFSNQLHDVPFENM